jgi:hypothetical protein
MLTSNSGRATGGKHFQCKHLRCLLFDPCMGELAFARLGGSSVRNVDGSSIRDGRWNIGWERIGWGSIQVLRRR